MRVCMYSNSNYVETNKYKITIFVLFYTKHKCDIDVAISQTTKNFVLRFK